MNNKKIILFLNYVITAISITSLIYILSFKTVKIYGNSMMPTLFNNDKLIIKNLLINKYNKNDIIIFKKKIFSSKFLAKRVIAIFEDKVFVNKHGDLYVNNNYIFNDQSKKNKIKFIPKNCVFAIGDNYNNSIDSRYHKIGIIHVKFIFGKTLIKLYPLIRIGVI